jgi:hypothetical protein
MKCKCGTQIPEARVNMGYRVCVECSTEARWSVVPVNYHKTGNTAEIIKDPELAEEFMFMSSRKGFGVMRGMTSTRRKKVTRQEPVEKKEEVQTTVIEPKVMSRYMPTYYFEEVGENAVKIAESESIDKALAYVETALNERLIYKKQADQIKEILNYLQNS